VSTNSHSWTVRAIGGARFISGVDTSSAGAVTSGVILARGAGAWTTLSDRNSKENFAPADSAEILSRLEAIPIQTWNYKTQDPSVRHIGPTAQDFREAFGLGDSGLGITTVDADGVALAAIQALIEENRRLQQRVEQLEQKIERQP